MKKSVNSLVILFLMISSISTFGQKKVFELISNAKNKGIIFKNQDVFSVLRDKKEQILNDKTFKNLERISLLNYNSSPSELQNSHISIKVPINGTSKNLDLIEVEDKFYSYDVVANKDKRYRPNRSQSKHYRGVVRDEEENSLVAISFFNGDVKGMISTKNGNYTIGKLRDLDKIIIYNERDLNKINDFERHIIKDDNFKGYSSNILKGTGFPDPFGTHCVRFYFETEFDIYQSLGFSVTNVENYVTALYNQVAILYYNEGIDTVISEINVWTSTDPYTSTNTAGLLTQFQNNTNSINGNLGHLLTFRNVGGGRAAGFNGLCNSNVDNSLAVSGNLNSTITNVPTYSWDVMVITHEFGHLFGLRHTHACVWNGNNTAIDGCSGFTEGNCTLPSAPTSGGTIMSYCHLNPVGINFTNGFGPQPGNVLRNNVANASCLTDCDGCVASGANFDLYMKDKPSDIGVEPNPDGVTWTSQDIWIRQNLDGGTVHQNAEYKNFTPNGVYVRVRNLGSQTSGCATLKVYWTKASAGLMWPTNFINFFQNIGGTPVLHGDIIGTAQIPAIAPGSSTIIELPWYPPNPSDFAADIHHFCLTARIISSDDPMTNEVFGRIEPNAKNNNNIIQKNISVQNNNPNNLPTGLFFRGVSKKSEYINILFRDKGFRDDKIDGSFFDRGGTVEVTTNEKIFERMLQNGSLRGEGIKILDKNKILIRSNDAIFNKIPLRYGESFLLQFKFNLEKIENKEEVIFDILQQSAEEEEIQGGERFVIVKSSENDEKFVAKPEKKLQQGIQIIPNPNDGTFVIRTSNLTNVEFSIYNTNGNRIYSGSLRTKETNLSLRKLPKGIYLIKVISGKTIIHKKFIKE